MADAIRAPFVVCFWPDISTKAFLYILWTCIGTDSVRSSENTGDEMLYHHHAMTNTGGRLLAA